MQQPPDTFPGAAAGLVAGPQKLCSQGRRDGLRYATTGPEATSLRWGLPGPCIFPHVKTKALMEARASRHEWGQLARTGWCQVPKWGPRGATALLGAPNHQGDTRSSHRQATCALQLSEGPTGESWALAQEGRRSPEIS